MMTPLEIQNKTVKKSAFGYDKAEVDEFMQQLYNEYDRVYMDNIALKDKIGVLSDAVKQYKAMEETLQNTLLLAQKTGDEIKKNADEKSGNIIREAELKAEKIVESAKKQVDEINVEYQQVKRDMSVYKAKMTGLLKNQIDFLSDIEDIKETEETKE